MDLQENKPAFARFNVSEIAKSFPETADTMLLDTYLTREDAASARVFRVYRGTPAHYHATCDEYLYVVSGRGTFWMGDPSNAGEFETVTKLYARVQIIAGLTSELPTTRE